jgi:hypothetical protein
MGGPKYISTFPKWTADIERRVQKLERRKHHRAFVRSAGNADAASAQGFTASEPTAQETAQETMWALPVGTTLRDNGDGTFTVVPSPPLTEYDEF